MRCLWGLCKSEGRQSLPGVYFVPFPKKNDRDATKCRRWVHLCGLKNLNVDMINRTSYVCSKHFIGGEGPTEMNPDPYPANLTLTQVHI
jgi:hypothetical protein